MDAQSAVTACNALGGKMYSPKSKDDNVVIENIDREDPVLQKLVGQSCGRNTWIGAYKVETSWMDLEDKTKKFDAIDVSKILSNGNDLEKCSYVKLGKGKYGDFTCSAQKCAFCEWERKLEFTLRGLCDESTVEDHYVLTNQLYFNGLMGE